MSKLMKVVDHIDAAIEAKLPQSEEAIKRRKNRILKPIGYTALAAGLVGFGVVAYEAVDHWNNSVPPVPSFPANPDQTGQDLDSGKISISVPPSPIETDQLETK